MAVIKNKLKTKMDWKHIAGIAAFFVGLLLIWYGSCVSGPQIGEASYYHDSLAGELTASGEPYDPEKLTAAHPAIPFGTQVRVTNLSNGKSVVVRINDRGPYADNRIIDLSRRAARELGMLQKGVVRVRVEKLDNLNL